MFYGEKLQIKSNKRFWVALGCELLFLSGHKLSYSVVRCQRQNVFGNFTLTTVVY